jgi:hypothetical protein
MPDETRGRIARVAFALTRAGWMAPGTAGDVGSLPTPPRQAEPWSPPATRLPRFLVSATPALFGPGLANPRGAKSEPAGGVAEVDGSRTRSGSFLPRRD